jgi:LmbE family N-acetylglucosaminyl deacetylase
MVQFISPHIDDAILSAAGIVQHLVKSNITVNIYYVFTVTNWTNPNSVSGRKYENDIGAITNLRKEEELAVAGSLGYDIEFLNFCDFSLRNAYSEIENRFLISRINSQLRGKIEKSRPTFFPMGHGHPDHVIIRDIGFALLQEGYNVVFYEDQPYAASALYNYQKVFSGFYEMDLEPVLVPVSIEEKISVLRLYSSQTSDEWIKDIINYSYSVERNLFYERFWAPKNCNIDHIKVWNNA